MWNAFETGRGRRHFRFGHGHPFTELFRNGENASLGIDIAREALRAGMREGERGGEFVNIFEDHPEWIVRDLGTIASTGRNGNLADAFIGSYSLTYTVASVSDNAAQVSSTAFNETTIDSATRIPGTDGQNFYPAHDWMTIANMSFGSYETIDQTITWRQEVYF